VRYRLLESVRQYAREKLDAAGETPDAVARPFAWALDLAVRANKHLDTGDPGTWLRRLESEHDNLRAALATGLAAEDPDDGMRMA
jgi:predicted ATPase